MIPNDRESILEEEVIILRNSGEIPEIAFQTSIYYLEKDEEGPQLTLQDDELHVLCDAALERAQEIVLRDLDPDNRDKTIYRGIARSIVNWQRLQNFCHRINRYCPGFHEMVFEALVAFLSRELEDVNSSSRPSSVNCSAGELATFIEALNYDAAKLPAGWESLCVLPEEKS